jgi:hypothetical protein
MNHIFMYIDNGLALVAVLRTELLEMCGLHSVQDQNPFTETRPTLTLKVQRTIFIKIRENFTLICSLSVFDLVSQYHP